MTRNRTTSDAAREALRQESHRLAALSSGRVDFSKRRLLDRLDAPPVARRWRMPVVVTLVAVVLVVGAVWVFQNEEPPGSAQPAVSDDVGKRPLRMEISGMVGLEQLDNLAEETVLSVPGDIGAKLHLPGLATIWVGEESEISLSRGAKGSGTRGASSELHKGSLLASFEGRSPDRPAFVQSVHGRIHIVGTVFSVHVDEGSLQLRLFEGRVRLETPAGMVEIDAGEYISISKGVVNDRRRLDPSDVIAALLVTEKTAALEGPPVPELVLEQLADEYAEPESQVSSGRQKRARVIPPADHKIEKAPVSEARYEMPEPDEMTVETDSSLVQEQVGEDAEAETLIRDACDSLLRGNSEVGKKKIEQYLRKHPEDRYWDHINDLMD